MNYEYRLILQDRDGRYLGTGPKPKGGVTFIDLLNQMGKEGWRYVEYTYGVLFERPYELAVNGPFTG